MKIQQIQIFSYLGIIGVLIVGAFALSYFISDAVKEAALYDTKHGNADFILQQSKMHLSESDFLPIDFEQKEVVFSNFFKQVDTSEVVRIKVWSIDGTIVFSNDKSIIGENFATNVHFVESMAGSVSAQIKEPEKPENISELGYGQLMEVYVPIIDDSGTIWGVIETYTSLDIVNTQIDKVNEIINYSIAIIISAVAAIVSAVFFDFRRSVIKPILNLQKMTKDVADGRLNTKVTMNADNEISELVSSFNKMTKSLEKTIELEKQLAKAEQNVKNEKLSAIGSLASRLAHDMRNPLSVINVSLELIKHHSEKPNENITKQINIIEQSIQRMKFQIDEVMDFVRTQPLERKNNSLLKILHHTIDGMNIPESVGINLPKEDIVLNCDGRKLEVVFVNIIINAIYAMHEVGDITIRIFDKVDNVMIEIEDTGYGIPEDVLPHIFEPLYTTKQEGTGLGLVSCKTIINQHGGTINAYNNPTRFVINLPKNISLEISNNER